MPDGPGRMSSHDPYVYRSGRTWAWNCPCGDARGGYRRRMDADEAAEQHMTAPATH